MVLLLHFTCKKINAIIEINVFIMAIAPDAPLFNIKHVNTMHIFL